MKRSKYKLLLTTFMGTLALTLSANFTYSQLVTRAYGDVNTSSSIDLQMSDSNTGTAVQNNLTLTNNGESVDLSKVTIRYYFTSDNSGAQTFNCYDGSITSGDTYKNIASYVKGNFVKLDAPLDGADTYLELSFDKNAGIFNSLDVLKLQTAINNNDWRSFDSSNDYSFNDSSKTVVLIDGQVVKGTIPTEKSQSSDVPIETVKDMTVAVSENSSDSSNSINPTFTITNTDNCDLDLKDVDLKYYYTADSDADQTFSCYYAGTIDGDYNSLTSAVEGKIDKLENPVDNADSCLNLTFSEGVLKAGQSMKVQTNVNKSDWSSFDKSNDYSYNDSDKIVASITGNVISGTSPIKDITKEDSAPKLTIGGVTGKGGDTISVPINISNIKEKGMRKFHVKLSYDPEILGNDCYLHYEKPLLAKNFPKDGKINIDFDKAAHTLDFDIDLTKCKDTNALYEDGLYATLFFKLPSEVEDGTSSLKVLESPTLTDASDKEYNEDTISLEINPINLIYNKDIEKNSAILNNIFTYDENTLADIQIPLKLYENTLENIEYFITGKNTVLVNGTDYIVQDNTLILKENFLKNFINKNTFLTLNFSAGKPVALCIHNKDFNEKVDTNFCGFNDDEANIAVADTSEPLTFTNKAPIEFVITNTSNVNMDLNLLHPLFYYERESENIDDTFTIDYLSIAGSNKNLIPDLDYFRLESKSYADWYISQHTCLSMNFKHEFLKPGETLLVHGYVRSKDDTLSDNDDYIRYGNKIVVEYNTDYLFGYYDDPYSHNSRVIPDSIEIDAEDINDSSIKVDFDGNTLSSISEYINGSLEKKLVKGTDYIISSRHEIILTKSFLESLNTQYTTLNFSFSKGLDDDLIIINNKFNNLEEGTLTLSNPKSSALG